MWNIETKSDQQTLRALYIIAVIGYFSIVIYSLMNVICYYRKMP